MKCGKLYADGRELQIEKRIGRGGEGEVFSLSNLPGYAAKLYFPGLIGEREQKIRTMVSIHLADNSPMVAFPKQIVVDGRGGFVGFIMRLVDKHKEIHELQTPSSRQKYFPKADYRFIVRVALNIARVFAQVHATGCVVGDINQRGILVSPHATVVIIDADSFQVTSGAQRYLCVVGVPEYTPPELQGKSLKALYRTTNHDAFGLAVCLFQLLCMDRHPFSGRYNGLDEMPIEKAIAEYRFAYSAKNNGMTPPPGTVRLSDFTPKIGQLFEAAFANNPVAKRPSAAAWVAALEELESSLQGCRRNKLHHYAQSAAECPWCRMERVYGRPLFLDTDPSYVNIPAGKFNPESGLVLDFSTILATVNGFAIPSSVSLTMPQILNVAKPSQAAQKALSRRRLRPVVKIAGIGALIGAIYGLSAGLPLIGALVIAALGIGLIFKRWSNLDWLLANHQSQSAAIVARIDYLQRKLPIERVIKKKAEILDAIDEFKQWASAFGSVKNDYGKHRKQKQLDDYLAQFAIRTAGISKINSGDLASLASYGFTTACDVKRNDVMQVHGIGPVKAASINGWIRTLESSFKYQNAYDSEDLRNIQQAQNEIIIKQQGLEERMTKLLDEFANEVRGHERWQGFLDPELQSRCQSLAQIEVDMRALGMVVPPRPSIGPTLVPLVSSFQKGANVPFNGRKFVGQVPAKTVGAPGLSCPRCNSPMVRRVARKGSIAGNAFWGCSRFPSCNGMRPI
jgi:DNA-binding helix-hairpin-helix protein with protein kinase domain